ncbi:MAG: DNA topoisomerase [bacterium]
MSLIVVESPTKVKTLSQLLDADWDFAVTAGHLYDLPDDEMGISDGYEPEWIPKKKKNIGQIRSAASSADMVYVASDPDREGEAIAWQVEELVLDNAPTRRLRLESLTESELTETIENAGETDRKLVEAQWARRLLDRLAGYKISPFLVNAFNGKSLSAGRVQSPVLSEIVDRWEAVQDFEPTTFYRPTFEWVPDTADVTEPFEAELERLDGDPIGTDDNRRLLTDKQTAQNVLQAVDNTGIEVVETTVNDNKSYPGYPFDSSAMLSVASSWFNWSSGKTMNVAQSLYDKGLITYHRSDSNSLSQQACRKAAGFITNEYGEKYHQWRGGGGGDQEGHEAIRAKYAGLTPGDLHSVSSSETTLYSAIWQRYIQSQMTPAVFRTKSVHTEPGANTDAVFKTTIRTLLEEGFYRCTRENETPRAAKERPMSDLKAVNESTTPNVLNSSLDTSETEGPSLFTEGSLISMMKEEGIGRPSTYSSTIERLRHRQYIESDDGKIIPTKRGRDVLYFLRRAVPRICDVDFTEDMESALDDIASGSGDWKLFVEEFDQKLTRWLDESEGLEPEGSAETEKEVLDYEVCPRCGEDLYLREGQYGEFVHCSDDECDFSSNPPAKTYECPDCGRKMVKQNGRKSTVYNCIAHPECDGKRPVGEPSMTLEEFREDAPDCPECSEPMVKRKGRYGAFWGCQNYPECEGTKQID